MHVRDLIIETDTAKLQTFKANLDNSRKAARDILNVIWGAAKGIPEREAVAQPIEDAFNKYEIELAACVELAMANRNAESLDYMRRVTFPKFLKTKKSMDDLILFMRAEGEAQLESNNATIASSNLVMFTFTGVAIIFSLLFGNYIAKLITSTIGQVTSNLAKVADGDLTVVSKAEHRDELGTMAESLNHTVVGLRQLISSLKKRH
jgi:methyl-accepting chemotaxis protein